MFQIETKMHDYMSEGLERFTSEVAGSCLHVGAAGMANVIYEKARVEAPKSKGKTHYFKGTHQIYGPYVPGSLRNAIYQYFVRDKSTDTRAVFTVRWRTNKPPVGVPYGFMVEYGTKFQRPNPFMERAAKAMPLAVTEGLKRMRERMQK